MNEEVFIKGIKTIFLDNYNESEKNQIIEEIENAMGFVFGDKYAGEIIKIEIMKNYSRGDNKKINGCFNSRTRILELGITSMDNIKKIRNIIAHELVHAKFNFGLLRVDVELFKLCSCDDYNIYMINEYMACKYSNDYSYSINELKGWLDKPQKNFDYYYNNRKSTDDKKRKDLCALICGIITASDKMKEIGKNKNKIKGKEINNIAYVLRNIEFMPSMEQYNELKELLIKQGFNQ